jgi:S-adenosylmethionine:tRNA ribosyltransferase-isomerase
VSTPAFALPSALEAREPPEARGVARDAVALMVARRAGGEIEHARFSDLPDLLHAGDLLVVNVSATLPAAIGARLSDGTRVRVHFASPAPHGGGERWILELRTPDGAAPNRRAASGELRLDGGARVELLAHYLASGRLWLARVDASEPLPAYLGRHGEPIRYGYVPERWPLDAYQTVYAQHPGSAEMASAGRPFTAELITRLVAAGVQIAPITLHAGVSSPERHEPPLPERFAVSASTARLVNAVRAWGGRVVAVGTTVVRALESVASPQGTLRAGEGWTGLVITPDRGLRAVDGLLTGWHEPEASHLQMLRAAAGDELLRASYREALERGYLWHEFGDSHLILP